MGHRGFVRLRRVGPAVTRENGILKFSQALALLGAGSEMPKETDELPDVCSPPLPHPFIRALSRIVLENMV